MRWRAINVLTNTPPRTQQRSPGPMQADGIMEPIVTKAAKQLGLDQVAIRRINAPEGKAIYGPPGPSGMRPHVTSAFVKEALDRGVEVFGWDARKERSGQRRGPKVRGIGVAVGPHGSGSVGFDSIMTIRPDGKLYVQSGVGNLGTHSVFDLARVAADVLAMPWEKVEVIWGNTGKHVRRQPDYARDDARQSRWRDGCEAEAAGHRGDGSWRLTGRLRAWQRARVSSRQPGSRIELRPGSKARHRARRTL
jgi:CO/xanthine dehydrogenase Mo-binding subunit